MKRYLLLSLVAGLVALAATSVSADDLNPPPWMGLEGTTAQWWEFYNAPSSPWAIYPEAVSNMYGDPCAWVPSAPPGSYWMNSYEGPGGPEQGVWKLDTGGMYFEIPNTEIEDRDSFKDVWIQVTYDAGGDYANVLSLVPFGVAERLDDLHQVLDSGFFYDVWQIHLEPNPVHERIWIGPKECSLYLDEVVIDTICIPEPATVGLLCIGAVALVRRRRRRA